MRSSFAPALNQQCQLSLPVMLRHSSSEELSSPAGEASFCDNPWQAKQVSAAHFVGFAALSPCRRLSALSSHLKRPLPENRTKVRFRRTERRCASGICFLPPDRTGSRRQQRQVTRGPHCKLSVQPPRPKGNFAAPRRPNHNVHIDTLEYINIISSQERRDARF